MKFTTLTIANFLAITEAEIELADRGLMLIQGDNRDDSSAISNGAGKSSLVDALCWVLYGVTARGATGDDVINDAAGKGTKVQVNIEDDKDAYRVARHRKHKDGKNSLQVRKFNSATKLFDIDLTKGTDKLTQEVVDKIIGSSLEVFKGSIYAGQENMPDLPGMTDKALKMLIEEAAGVTVLEDAYKEARERLAQVKVESDTLANGIDNMKMRRDAIDDQIKDAMVDQARWETDRKGKIANAKIEITGLISDVKALDGDIAKADELKINAGLNECDRKLASLGDEQKKQRELVQKASAAQAQLSAAKTRLQQAEAAHVRQRTTVHDVQHKIGCPCGECGQPLSKEALQTTIDHAVEKLADTDKIRCEAKDAVKQAEKSTQTLTSALQQFEATMTDPSATTAQRASLQAQLDSLNKVKRERERLATRAKQLGEEAKRLAAQDNPYTASIKTAQDKREAVEKQIDDLADKLQKAQADVDVAETVVKVFAPAGVRAHILDEVTPYLNQQTAKYLETMSDGNMDATWTTLVKNAKGDLREKFSIEVTNSKGGKSFTGQSGGEKRKVRVSTALALQDLVATRASKPIELFIGDEIDDALDPAGLERLTQILDEKAKERGSVFIISHSDIRDWISQVITVRKEGGKTTILEETA